MLSATAATDIQTLTSSELRRIGDEDQQIIDEAATKKFHAWRNEERSKRKDSELREGEQRNERRLRHLEENRVGKMEAIHTHHSIASINHKNSF